MSAPIESRALVLGAGISGLAAARQLRRSGHAVVVLEGSNAPGGVMRTLEVAGCRFELGPNTVQRTPELEALCQDAGHGDDLRNVTPTAKKRYLLRSGQLVAAPASPSTFLKTPLFSARGKIRLMTEPFRRRGPGPQESLAEFVRRRMGAEAVGLIDAIAHGVYAGDPAELAVGYAFPKVYRLEAQYGSLIKGMLRMRSRTSGPGGPTALVGYRDGFAAMATDLASDLEVRYGCEAERVTKTADGFSVEVFRPGGRETFEASRLVSTLPAGSSASAFEDLGDLRILESIPHATVAVLNLVLPSAAITHPLDGFGFLAADSENVPILGCLFISSLFDDAAPADRIALTVLMGGRRHPELVEPDDETLIDLALGALRGPLGLSGSPIDTAVTRWRPGIPQATALWPTIQAAADAVEAQCPGLSLLGSWRTGPGVANCVRAGWTL